MATTQLGLCISRAWRKGGCREPRRALKGRDTPQNKLVWRQIDLRGFFFLPGFVDTNVHFFIHIHTEKPLLEQVLGVILVERTVRAVMHAQRTLRAGFTTVRDLGSESESCRCLFQSSSC